MSFIVANSTLEKNSSYPSSNVMPVDPQTGKPSRVKIKVEDGKKVRVAKSGAALGTQG